MRIKMKFTRRTVLSLPLAAHLAAQPKGAAAKQFVRFERGGKAAYGSLAGEFIAELTAAPYAGGVATGRSHNISTVRLLYPCEPSKVLAVGRNYKSHIGNEKAPTRPEFFYKPVSCLQNPGDPIVIPKDSKNTHYEAELVLVIGAKLKSVSRTQAEAGIFGYTCGNDVSERDWQGGKDPDMQWWRAKGADTYGPLGPVIVTGWKPGPQQISLRLNGEVKQKQVLSDLLFDCPAIVEFASRYVTLLPGDVIFTGTPGSTSAMKHGDTVEVEIVGIGVLKNPVVGAL
jgi:2-keto-4-pentenoate hydratase/2-oxohepta-3-ene-1,7-dioic acid hydratase in catechol pathway